MAGCHRTWLTKRLRHNDKAVKVASPDCFIALPPFGTYSVSFWFFAMPALGSCFLFFRFFFWKKVLRSEAEQEEREA